MAKATAAQQNDFDAVFYALDDTCTTPFASWCARTGGFDRIRLSVAPIWPEGEAATRAICPTSKSADGLTAAQYRFFYALFSSNWKEKGQNITLKRTLLPAQNSNSSTTAKRALSNARGASLLLLDHGDASIEAETVATSDDLYAHVRHELQLLYLQYSILESERDLVLDICRDMQAHVKERLGKAILDHPKVELFTDKKYWYQFLPLEKSRSFDRTCNRIAQAIGVQGMAEADSELPLVTPRTAPSNAVKPPVPTLPKKADSLSSRSKHPESEAIKYNAKRLIMENLQDAATLLMDVRTVGEQALGFNVKDTTSVSGTWLWGFTQGNTSDDARRALLAADARDKWIAAGLLLADWLLDCAKGSDDKERLARIQGATDAIVERLDGNLSDTPATGELAALYAACAPTLTARETLGSLMAGILYALVYGTHLEQAGLGASSLQADISTVWAAGDTPSVDRPGTRREPKAIAVTIASCPASAGGTYSPQTCNTHDTIHISKIVTWLFGRSPRSPQMQDANVNTTVLDDPAISRQAVKLYWDDTCVSWQMEVFNRNGANCDGELIESGETVDVAPGTRICLRGSERNYFLLLSGA
jgi:hypothetical protein